MRIAIILISDEILVILRDICRGDLRILRKIIEIKGCKLKNFSIFF
jgi:hypothetical protein